MAVHSKNKNDCKTNGGQSWDNDGSLLDPSLNGNGFISDGHSYLVLKKPQTLDVIFWTFRSGQYFPQDLGDTIWILLPGTDVTLLYYDGT